MPTTPPYHPPLPLLRRFRVYPRHCSHSGTQNRRLLWLSLRACDLCGSLEVGRGWPDADEGTGASPSRPCAHAPRRTTVSLGHTGTREHGPAVQERQHQIVALLHRIQCCCLCPSKPSTHLMGMSSCSHSSHGEHCGDPRPADGVGRGEARGVVKTSLCIKE